MSQLFFKLSQALKEQDSAMDRDISIEDIEISTNEDEYQEVCSKVKGKKARGNGTNKCFAIDNIINTV